MGLSMIIFGFFCLHFHFLNVQIYNMQLFPLTVSLPIIILGFLYFYRDSRKKENLYFIILCVILIMMTFIPNFRFPYLILLTFTYTFYVYYISKQIEKNMYKKYFQIWTSIYFISGFLKASTSLGGLWIQHDLNEISSILFALSVMILSYYLWKVRKMMMTESRPQITPPHHSYFVQLIIIIFCILTIIFTHPLVIEHSYNQAVQLDIYELSNEKVKIQYFIEWGIHPMRVQDSGVTPSIELLTKDRPHEFAILLNNEIFSKGHFQYKDDHYQYIEEERHMYPHYFEIIPDCTVLIDNKQYETKIQKVFPDMYGYKDNHIQLSHIFIQNGHVLVMPRVEFFHQKVTINKISIQNSAGQILNQLEMDPTSTYYHDGQSFSPEIPLNGASEYKEGPYYCTITYTTEDNKMITKEYPLTI